MEKLLIKIHSIKDCLYANIKITTIELLLTNYLLFLKIFFYFIYCLFNFYYFSILNHYCYHNDYYIYCRKDNYLNYFNLHLF